MSCKELTPPDSDTTFLLTWPFVLSLFFMRTKPLKLVLSAEALNLWVLPPPAPLGVWGGASHRTRRVVLRYQQVPFSFTLIIDASSSHPCYVSPTCLTRVPLPSIFHPHHSKFSPTQINSCSINCPFYTHPGVSEDREAAFRSRWFENDANSTLPLLSSLVLALGPSCLLHPLLASLCCSGGSLMSFSLPRATRGC